MDIFGDSQFFAIISDAAVMHLLVQLGRRLSWAQTHNRNHSYASSRY